MGIHAVFDVLLSIPPPFVNQSGKLAEVDFEVSHLSLWGDTAVEPSSIGSESHWQGAGQLSQFAMSEDGKP